jgi:hypothetical protein
VAQKYRKNSEFGDGKRVKLCREWKARIKARLRMKAYNGPGKLTGTAQLLGGVLLDMAGPDGCLCPSIETLAALLGKSCDAIQRALARLRQLGFLDWTRRVVRLLDGGRCARPPTPTTFVANPETSQ